MLATLSSNAAARDMSWEYVKANWKTKIMPMFEGQHSLYAYCVVLPIRGFVTEEKAREAEEFFKENPVPSATMRLSQTLESMRTKIAWLRGRGCIEFLLRRIVDVRIIKINALNTNSHIS